MTASSQTKIIKTAWAIFAVLVIPGLFLGCGGIKEKKLEKEGITLIYRPKAQAGSDINKLDLNHPIKISEREFENHLYSLQYEELSLLGKKKYVLSLNELKEYTKILTKAVNRMAAKNILIFDLQNPRGSTRGEIFATGDKINFRFDTVKGVEFSGNSFAGVGGSTWRMVPVKGQRFQVTKKLLGTSSKENWVIADMKLPNIARRLIKRQRTESSKSPDPEPSSEPVQSKPSATNPEELEKKLQFLKDLREKNLIDADEYEKKRKELLDSFL